MTASWMDSSVDRTIGSGVPWLDCSMSTFSSVKLSAATDGKSSCGYPVSDGSSVPAVEVEGMDVLDSVPDEASVDVERVSAVLSELTMAVLDNAGAEVGVRTSAEFGEVVSGTAVMDSVGSDGSIIVVDVSGADDISENVVEVDAALSKVEDCANAIVANMNAKSA